jgi:hypothetical protein
MRDGNECANSANKKFAFLPIEEAGIKCLREGISSVESLIDGQWSVKNFTSCFSYARN